MCSPPLSLMFHSPPVIILTVVWPIITVVLLFWAGPGSSVGIATDYGLDGPGSNPGREEIFLPFAPALGHAADHSPPYSAAIMEE